MADRTKLKRLKGAARLRNSINVKTALRNRFFSRSSEYKLLPKCPATSNSPKRESAPLCPSLSKAARPPYPVHLPGVSSAGVFQVVGVAHYDLGTAASQVLRLSLHVQVPSLEMVARARFAAQQIFRWGLRVIVGSLQPLRWMRIFRRCYAEARWKPWVINLAPLAKFWRSES